MAIRKSRTLIVAGLLFHLLAGAATAQSDMPSDQELQSILQERVDQRRAVGVVLGIIEPGGRTRIFSAGTAGPGAGPVGEQTVFEIGSITKVFTATMLADMVRRGEVSLSDPASKYLPAGVTVPARNGREITLLDLSTHQSGLPRLPLNLNPADINNPYADYTVEQLYEFLAGYRLPRDIGSQFEYSNLGGGLLGHVLSLAAGIPYEALVRDRVLRPLGMTSTGIALDPGMGERMAQGHDLSGRTVPLWDLPTLAGAGALRSSVPDMLRFLEANLGEPRSELERAMRDAQEPHASVTAGQGPDGAQIGLNWLIQPAGDSRVVWHNGGTGGFRSFIGFDPDREVGVVVLANSGHAVDDIGIHLLDPSVPLAEAPPQRVEVPVALEILQQYVGRYEAPATIDFSLEITLEDGVLFGAPENQPKLPIFPESESAFFLRAVDAQITFERDAAGNVESLYLTQSGQSIRMFRVR